MHKVLIIDDDIELCELLSEYLTDAGFAVTTVQDGLAGVKQAVSHHFAVVVLDVMLPKLNGFEVLKKIRLRSEVPVLMLTARGEDVDRIVGLEVGADDYLPKPCNPRELVARLHAILRRVHKVVKEQDEPQLIVIDDLELDCAKRKVKCRNEEVELTNSEFNILKILLTNIGKVITKDQLTREALGKKTTPYDRSIDMHISNLRAKLGNNQKGQVRIKTTRGYGYSYEKEH